MTTDSTLLYLVSCTLNSVIPNEEYLSGIDSSALYKKADAHKIVCLVADALIKTKVFDSLAADEKKKWLNAQNNAVRRAVLFDSERESIIEDLEKTGIWYMPLKGTVLAPLYPQYGMREYSDNDIFFDKSRKADVKEIMLKHGFKLTTHYKSNHDAYEKEPIFNFEMHSSLASEIISVFSEYYSEAKSRLIKDDGNKYGYHFSVDDFYIYQTAHSNKHYTLSGDGLRSLCDEYVYLKKYGDVLDFPYIEEECRKLGIYEYEMVLRSLAMKIFSSVKPIEYDELTEEESEMLKNKSVYVYGTQKVRIANKLRNIQGGDEEISRKTKFLYCLRRIFPPREYFKIPYPFFYKFPVFIPFFWVFRLFRGLFTRMKSIVKEIKTLKSE